MTPEEEIIAIARELASSQPTRASGTWHWCGVCGKSLAMGDDPESHADDCLWVRLQTAVQRLDELRATATVRRSIDGGPWQDIEVTARGLAPLPQFDELGVHTVQYEIDWGE